MVSHLKTFTNKGCKSLRRKKFLFVQILQGSGGYKIRIRRLYFPTRLRKQNQKNNQKVSFSANFALLAGFFWYLCYYPHRSRYALSPVCVIFKEWDLWADAFYKSICPYVCLCVCVFNFEIPFKRLFASTLWSRMSKKFWDSEYLGIRRLYNKDLEVIQQGSGGYVLQLNYGASPENFSL